MNNKEKKFVSVVVCIHENDVNVLEFLTMINKELSDNFDAYEFVCVCNEMATEAAGQIRCFSDQNESVTVSIITMKFEQGLETMMNAGTSLAIGDFVFEFDSCYVDYETSLLMQLYHDVCEKEYDIVVAVPPRNESKWRSRMYYGIFNHFAKMQSELRTERFRVISRRAVNRILSYSNAVPYRKAVHVACGLKVKTIEYTVEREKKGICTDDVKKYDTAVDSLILFTNLACKFSVFVFAAMMIFMIILFGNLLFTRSSIVHQSAEDAFILGLLSVGFCLVLSVLVVVIKSLDILLRLIFNKQKFILTSVEKL